MRTLHSYRLVPALLALCLVLTAAAPLARHSCGMAETATMPCCPPGTHEAPAHEAPAHPMPDALPCHSTPAEHEAPAAPEAPCSDASDWTTMRAGCCASVETPAAPAPERVLLLPADLPALVAAFVLPLEPSPSPSRWSGALSPPAPVALHVLYESFLI